MQQARIARRQVALQHHLAAEFAGSVLDRGGQRQPVLRRIQRRKEHVDQAIARLDAERGAHRIRLIAADDRKFLHHRTEPLGAGAHEVGRRHGEKRLKRRQRRMRGERIRLGLVFDLVRVFPRQAVQRQPEADR